MNQQMWDADGIEVFAGDIVAISGELYKVTGYGRLTSSKNYPHVIVWNADPGRWSSIWDEVLRAPRFQWNYGVEGHLPGRLHYLYGRPTQ